MNQPEDDGKTHINVYSKGATELGRMANNFAHTPFELLVDGALMRFESGEGWWYWFKTRNEELAKLWGFEAKKRGLEMQAKFNSPKPDDVLAMYQAKASQNPRLGALLRANSLPYDHYYVYGGKRKSTEHQWTGELWARVAT